MAVMTDEIVSLTEQKSEECVGMKTSLFKPKKGRKMCGHVITAYLASFSKMCAAAWARNSGDSRHERSNKTASQKSYAKRRFVAACAKGGESDHIIRDFWRHVRQKSHLSAG